MEQITDNVERTALEPLTRTGKGYYLLILGLLVVIGNGIYAYITQLQSGLAVTGMSLTLNKIIWGLYIVNFIFFIGISHAGTLISAILRIFNSGWRTPVTRMAEFITVVALTVGGLFPIIDLGRPDRVWNLFNFGRWQSPIVWDLLSILTYLTGSLIYLYLPLIPDLALCRDRLSSLVPPWKRRFYQILSAGWTGRSEQKQKLHRAIGLMMIVIVPVAVSVHTVVSWIFAMTLRTGWNSTVFGIYFVAGAIFSGVATLILVMAVLRKVFHLEKFITQKHFVNLGFIMAAFTLIMLYFNLSEYLTAGYKMSGSDSFFLSEIFTGAFAPIYWAYIIGGLIIPGLIMIFPATRKLPGILTAAVLVNIAMWLERYAIVIGSLRVPQMPYPSPANYLPSGAEIAITAAAFALFVLVIAIFAKLFPLISVWEVKEHLSGEGQKSEAVSEGVLIPGAIPQTGGEG